MSSDEARERSWSRLRRSHLKKENNPAVREWEAIDARNHFGPGFEKAVKDAMRRRFQ
jgi:hypothetical protein